MEQCGQGAAVVFIVHADDEGENEPAANNGSDTPEASGSGSDAAKAKKTQQPA